MIVIDASAALALAFNEDNFADRFAERLASERLIAPPIWRLEVVNVILRNERRHLITAEQGNRILAALETICDEIVDAQSDRTLAQLVLCHSQKVGLVFPQVVQQKRICKLLAPQNQSVTKH